MTTSQVVARTSTARAPSCVLDTRWYCRVVNGELRSLTLDETCELFAVVGGLGAEDLELPALRQAVLGEAPPAAVERKLEELLRLVEEEEGGRLNAESFLQAMRLEAVSARLACDDDGDAGQVQRGHLLSHLRMRKEHKDNCLSLPFTFLLYFLFCLLVVCHFHQTTVYKMVLAASRDAPLVAMQQNYPIGMLSWLDSRVGVSRIARFNQIVGGIHLAALGSNPGLVGSRVETLCPYTAFDFLERPSRDQPELCRTAAQRPGNDTRIWLPWALSDDAARDVVKQVRSWWGNATDIPTRRLRASGGASQQTEEGLKAVLPGPEWVQVSFLAHNAKLNYYVFYRLLLHVLDTGALEGSRSAIAFDAAPPWIDSSQDFHGERAALMLADVLFIVLLCGLLLWEQLRLVQSIRRGGCWRGLKAYCTIWELIDWVTIIMGFFLCFLYPYTVELTRGLQQLQVGLPALNETARLTRSELEAVVASAASLSWAEYWRRLEATLEQAALVAKAAADARWYASVFACCMCFRFFKAFRANPRLNVVVLTVCSACGEFTHFLFVFACTFGGFVLVAHSVFGPLLADFSSLGEALHTSFMIMLGFSFDHLRDRMFGGDAGGALGILWAGAFHIFIVLLILDMVVAIILDVYSRVKSSAGEAPTPLRQARELFIDGQAAGGTKAGQPVAPPQKRPTQVSGSMRANQSMVVQVSPSSADMRILLDLDTCGGASDGKQKAAPAKPKRRRWTEARLLAALEKRGDIGEQELLTAEALVEELEACTPLERQQLQGLLQQAAAVATKAAAPPLTLSDSIRLCGRADAAVRELTPLARSLAAAARASEAERRELRDALEAVLRVTEAVPRETGARRTHGKAKVPPPLTVPLAERRGSEREDPDPEPPTSFPGGPTVEQAVGCIESLERQAELANVVERLAQGLEPLLEQRAAQQHARQAELQHIAALEVQLQALAAALAPLVDIDGSGSPPALPVAATPPAAAASSSSVPVALGGAEPAEATVAAAAASGLAEAEAALVPAPTTSAWSASPPAAVPAAVVATTCKTVASSAWGALTASEAGAQPVGGWGSGWGTRSRFSHGQDEHVPLRPETPGFDGFMPQLPPRQVGGSTIWSTG